MKRGRKNRNTASSSPKSQPFQPQKRRKIPSHFPWSNNSKKNDINRINSKSTSPITWSESDFIMIHIQHHHHQERNRKSPFFTQKTPKTRNNLIIIKSYQIPYQIKNTTTKKPKQFFQSKSPLRNQYEPKKKSKATTKKREKNRNCI